MATQTEMRSSAAHSNSRAGRDVVLRVSGVAKSFGATKALRNLSFDVLPGEIHTIQGENGSGKSTLVKVLAGVYAPDAGTLEVAGETLSAMQNPSHSQSCGIGIVFQEVLVAGPRSVLENVWLGSDSLFGLGGINESRKREAAAVLEALLGHIPDLTQPIEHLSLSDRQACAIARAVLRDPDLLVLDEATSALDVATRDRLFELLRKRTAENKSVLFISHRMDEVTEISDRVTVMRLGETVETLTRADATPTRLVQLMTANDELPAMRRGAQQGDANREIVLSARHTKLALGRDEIDLDVHAGEMIGLSGLDGHGQEALLHALSGGFAFGGTVVMTGPNGPVAITSKKAAADNGIALVPRERKTEALFAPLTILDNFALPTLAKDSKFGLVSRRKSIARFLKLADRLGISFNDVNNAVSTLSGGNQQKVVMARWLAADPKVLLLNDPTRGVDAHTKQDLYSLLKELTESGLAVVMISSEVDEHLALMDRVLVMRDQEIFQEFQRDEISREALVSAYFGKNNGK